MRRLTASRPWDLRLLWCLLSLAFAVTVGSFGSVHAQNRIITGRPSVSVTAPGGDALVSGTAGVVVRVTIANASEDPVEVLRWSTPIDGMNGPLFTVLYEGRPVPYLGRVVKLPVPTRDDYIRIAPGEAISLDVDLSAYYEFRETGAYDVSFALAPPDTLATDGAGRLPRSKLATLVSNSIRLAVEGRAPPVIEEVRRYAVTGSNVFSNCSGSQVATLGTARADASTYANDAVTYFAAASHGARYTRWFGTYDATRYGVVSTHFSAIRNVIDTATPMSFDCAVNPAVNGGSYYAYVYPSAPYFYYLGSLFWTAPPTGTDSRAGTLIHETSHFTVVAGTSDYAYGQDAAALLAVNNPDFAIMNADSHEYLAENNPPVSESGFGVNLILDPGFEAGTGTPAWNATSTNFGTPLCTVALCGDGGTGSGPRSGSVWAWFGGTSNAEDSSLSQTLSIPVGRTALQFYLWMPAVASGAGVADRLRVMVDGNIVFEANATNAATYPAYTLVTVDLGLYADGSTHTLQFAAHTDAHAGPTSFFVDDLSLVVTARRTPSDFDGDGKTDPAKYVPTAGAVWYRESTTGNWAGRYIGNDGIYLVDSDFDGDGKVDMAKYVASAGAIWYLKSSTLTWDGIYIGSDGIPVMGSDFDGDGKTDPAKIVNGTLWYLASGTGTWHGVYVGADGPYVSRSDFDGDGKTDPAKFVNGTLWYLASSTGTWHGVFVGTDGPYVEGSDFDGDGKSDPAKFVNGTVWYLKSSTGTWASRLLGTDGLYVAGADFDGDGRTDPTKFVTSSGALWYWKSAFSQMGSLYMGPGAYQIVD